MSAKEDKNSKIEKKHSNKMDEKSGKYESFDGTGAYVPDARNPDVRVGSNNNSGFSTERKERDADVDSQSTGYQNDQYAKESRNGGNFASGGYRDIKGGERNYGNKDDSTSRSSRH